LSNNFDHEPMLDMFIFETMQLLEQLEQNIISSEKEDCFTQFAINEIFRIMHTIKGSSAMMLFNNISTLAHSIEDLFFFLREEKPKNVNCSELSDLVLEGVDFIKVEMEKIRSGDHADRDASDLIERIKGFLTVLRQLNSPLGASEIKGQKTEDKGQYCISQSKPTCAFNKNAFKAVIYFEDDCKMENIRAFAIIHNLKDIADEIYYIPEDILENDNSVQAIREQGFKIFFKTDCSYKDLHEFFMQSIFLKDLELIQLDNDEEFKQFSQSKQIVLEESPAKVLQIKDQGIKEQGDKEVHSSSTQQSIISINVTKLDKLMDLVGELVISEAMVTQNPDIKGLTLDNFQKAARQHRKIISELQDMVMSIRMVPLAATFHKMNRIVRDMSKKLNKEVELEIIGEETEVDKNIIDRISDPLMHLIRNAIDHGIETLEQRQIKGKTEPAKVTLEARNAGGDVLVIVRDNGRGLNKKKILQRASENGLIHKSESELTDKEIYSYIFLPGFSTKDKVTEFSGRGVGMDVVTKNIGAVGGTVSVDSVPGEGTTITLKIPLTLAIMDGMTIRVGKSTYTVPIISIKESFKAKESDVITDPDGNEMIMIRGECYPILRLHNLYEVKTEITSIPDGIIVMVENEGKGLCIFADELIGEQQVVVKALPNYIRNIKKVRGLAGCTLLGDGSISLILDIAGLLEK